MGKAVKTQKPKARSPAKKVIKKAVVKKVAAKKAAPVKKGKVSRADFILSNIIQNYPRDTVACFDPVKGNLPRRKLDEDKLVAYLEKLAKNGAGAVLIAASAGGGHLRTVDELDAWFRASCKAKLGKTVKMALLRPEDSRKDNQRLVQTMKESGFDVGFIRVGTNLVPGKATDKQVADNMRPLVQMIGDAGMAVGCYSISNVSGNKLSANALANLVKGKGGDKIAAVKLTELSYDDSTLQFLKHKDLRHLKIVQGWDAHISRAFMDGPKYHDKGLQRVGITSGIMAYCQYQYKHLLTNCDKQNWKEVCRTQVSVTAMMSALQDDPTKIADLQRAKWAMGLGHPVNSKVDPKKANKLIVAIEATQNKGDRKRLARSVNMMGCGPYAQRLSQLY